MAFHNDAAEFFQIAVNVFYFIRQLFDFGFKQIEQQFISVAIGHGLGAGAHTVETKRRQLTLTQRKQSAIADSERHGGVSRVIVGIFEKEKGVNVQAVFVFKKTRRRLDIFQFWSRGQALTQLRLHPKTLIVIRFDQIHPH